MQITLSYTPNTAGIYKIERDVMPSYLPLFEIGLWEFWGLSEMQLPFHENNLFRIYFKI
jgi:hypothetical protein